MSFSLSECTKIDVGWALLGEITALPRLPSWLRGRRVMEGREGKDYGRGEEGKGGERGNGEVRGKRGSWG